MRTYALYRNGRCQISDFMIIPNPNITFVDDNYTTPTIQIGTPTPELIRKHGSETRLQLANWTVVPTETNIWVKVTK